MPTKEQLTQGLEEAQADVSSLHERLQVAKELAALQDSEAKALDKVVQALKELDHSDSRRQSRDTYGTIVEVGTAPISRVLNAAAARFGITMDYQTLIEAIGKLTEANQTQTELEELKNRWSAVEQVMYPRTVEFDPMKRVE